MIGWALLLAIAAPLPCDDFYSHICTPEIIRDLDSRDYSYFVYGLHEPQEKIRALEKKALEGLLTQSGLKGRKKVLRDFYAACIDSDFRMKAEAAWIKQAQAGLLKEGPRKLRPQNETERLELEKMVTTFFRELKYIEPERRAREFLEPDQKIFDLLESKIQLSFPQFSKERFAFLARFRGGPKTPPSLPAQCVESAHLLFGDDLAILIRDQLPWKKYKPRIDKIFDEVRRSYEKEFPQAEIRSSLKSLKLTWQTGGGASSANEMVSPVSPETFFSEIEKVSPVISALDSNSSYHKNQHQILFPIALAQPPLITDSNDVGVRFILAHEVFHSVRWSLKSSEAIKKVLAEEQGWAVELAGLGYRLQVGSEVTADQWGLKIAQATSKLPAADFYRLWARLGCTLFLPEAADSMKLDYIYPIGADRVNPVLNKDAVFLKTFSCPKR